MQRSPWRGTLKTQGSSIAMGLHFRFSNDDIRAIGLTMFIELGNELGE